MKKAFLLYIDMHAPIKKLSDEDAGRLLKAIFEYANGGRDQELSASASVAFAFIKQQLDRDCMRYTETCERNRDNANKRWHPKDASACDRIRVDAKHANKDKDKDKDKEDKKHKYGEFKHVLLTDKEFDKLKDKVDNREEWIKTLDEGLELKDYGYKSHYMAILKWYRKENEKKGATRKSVILPICPLCGKEYVGHECNCKWRNDEQSDRSEAI